MKLFQTFERLFVVVAVRSRSAIPDSNPFFKLIKLIHTHFSHRAIYFLHVSCFGVGFPHLILYIFVEAKTFRDYFECFYPLITTIINFCNITTLFLNRTKVFGLIDSFESTIQKRKHKKNP